MHVIPMSCAIYLYILYINYLHLLYILISKNSHYLINFYSVLPTRSKYFISISLLTFVVSEHLWAAKQFGDQFAYIVEKNNNTVIKNVYKGIILLIVPKTVNS